MIRHKDSHLDHGLTPTQIEYILERFAGRDAFFIETVELPPELGTVPCGLYGPVMGDGPIADYNVDDDTTWGLGLAFYRARGTRAYESRLVRRPTRPTNKVTVIAGPHDSHPCVLVTAFGGPATPQEPGDPSCKDVEASKAFWSEHALAAEPGA